MYFAHHQGKYIRLAYSDRLYEPWQVFEPGVLHLKDSKLFRHHIASPDVHVNHNQQKIIMYFHDPVEGIRGQWTGLATSTDGINFSFTQNIYGKYCFRVFSYQNELYAIAKDFDPKWSVLYKASKNGKFRQLAKILPYARHSTALVRNNRLYIFFSQIGDAPERIKLSTVKLWKNWREWKFTEPLDVVLHEMEYEGIKFDIKPSSIGYAINVRELRDPYVFENEDKLFLFYSVSGEAGISGAELIIEH